MSIVASIIAAIIPMLLYLYILWHLDKYEREPAWYLIKHFLWGAFGAIFFGIIGSLAISSSLLSLFQSTNEELIMTIVAAPIVEEIAKGVFLLRTVRNINFDNITDGLVYGGAIGLGFGMTENFMYFISYGETLSDWIFLVIVRTAFTAVMHAIATGTFGAFMGLAKFSPGIKKVIYPIVGLILAMILHFAWNISVSFDSSAIYGLIFMIVIIFTFFAVFIQSLKKEKEIIINELRNENLSEEFIKSLFTKKGRNVNKDYSKLLIKLAFRKRQVRNSAGKKKELYSSRVEILRQQLMNYKLTFEFLEK